jgi:hypothetical protein
VKRSAELQRIGHNTLRLPTPTVTRVDDVEVDAVNVLVKTDQCFPWLFGYTGDGALSVRTTHTFLNSILHGNPLIVISDMEGSSMQAF